ncbi:MAG TPA: hypothetical protein VFB67_13525 [Candidatus Polarisedimenticolaceae bacterium]|nr:hypothetical protein [Candidatus Polarisedimenticolaceae bacterium]
MPFGSLWIPVLVSAVVVFVLSAVIHMALKYHRSDIKKLPNEEVVRSALGRTLPRGVYCVPYAPDGKAMQDPACQAKYKEGPVAIITVAPIGPPAMGKYLGLWFGFTVLVSFLTSYVARHTLTPGTDDLLVMRVTSAVAFMAYGLSHVSDSIWKAQPWSNTARALIDALIYAVATGAVFCWLWPSS